MTPGSCDDIMGQVSDNDWLFWHKQANGCGLKPTMSSLWSKVTHTHRDMVSCLFFPSWNQGPISRFVNFFIFVFLEGCWSVPDTHICQTKYEPESRFVSLSAFFSSLFYKNSCDFRSCKSHSSAKIMDVIDSHQGMFELIITKIQVV